VYYIDGTLMARLLVSACQCLFTLCLAIL